ncbi:hypothetical protein CcI156_19960 [Frankia sp. CcI156]|uniref:head maturation protease, ClpP-related n=1 Tax=Frankia TaxID=1854 RepID=UPI0003CFA197|nr:MULTISPECIES: head maturation protease, ClpP-related [Frankia]ETA00416.1 protease subunit of ATP-dependent protease [Frankia sp. CcI6]KFB03034.1 protease subunit of ATP-dependent protease [Frankia sp. Allo2]OAA20065.1 protease subunit of ATP-dependent protease [Frankia casuarinae]OHV51109.1 hypothetical protein CgIS1_19565 [Frankia sp. CgIS1]ONH22915.1 hypothetical protein CcI156_19960 [Frankia sp. CcI156]
MGTDRFDTEFRRALREAFADGARERPGDVLRQAFAEASRDAARRAVSGGVRASAALALAPAREGLRVANRAGLTADAWLMDEIGWGGVDAATFVRELSQITAPAVTLHLNSPGGDLFDGWAIRNALRSHPARVTAVVEGLAASAASVVATGADRVVMRPGSQQMIHDARSGWGGGNPEELRRTADQLDRLSDDIAAAYAARAGGDASAWRDLMRRETWFSATEAVAAGLADEESE